jgi:3-methyl-2-oxobutanoate hydroxymethyltransferase
MRERKMSSSQAHPGPGVPEPASSGCSPGQAPAAQVPAAQAPAAQAPAAQAPAAQAPAAQAPPGQAPPAQAPPAQAASGQASPREGLKASSPKPGVPSIRDRKRSAVPLVMVTAYDAPSARAAMAGDVDIILVGDSLGMVVLGYEDTLHVTMEDMVSHTAAVARAKPPQLIVADMPWTSYHQGTAKAVANAARLVRAGAGAVKLEGGAKRLEVLHAILNAEVPVMGHLGLTPQSVHAMGGFRVQGRRPDEAKVLIEDAIAIADAGCFAIVLEGIPEDLATEVTRAIPVPTIGIGAGGGCDGQVLVFHDIVGFGGGRTPRFARRYADLDELAGRAVARWAADVRTRLFPSADETYH